MLAAAALGSYSLDYSVDAGVWHDVTHIYRQRIILTGREPQVLVLLGFLVTIALARLSAHAVRRGWPVARDLHVRGVHVHHFVPGILLLIVSGYLAIAVQSRAAQRAADVGFGIGAGLTLDEFALWLHLEDVYWSERGRKSVLAMIVALALAGLVFIGADFWSDLLHRVLNLG